MLPDIDADQCSVTGGQRGTGGAHVDDFERAVGLFDQPRPARTEVADGRCLKRLLEVIHRTPFGLDGLAQRASRFAATLRRQAVPEEGVIPDLGGVVVDAAGWCLDDDVFEGQIFVLGALDQVIQVGDIGLMMLAVVKVERFRRNVRSQCVLLIGQGGQEMFHDESSRVELHRATEVAGSSAATGLVPVPCMRRRHTKFCIDDLAAVLLQPHFMHAALCAPNVMTRCDHPGPGRLPGCDVPGTRRP